MTALLASLLLALSQETAEDAFNKVEAAIEAARTVRVTFTIDAANEEARPGTGSLTLEEGGRVRLEGSLRDRNGEKLEFSEDCDGKKVVSSIGPRRVEGLYDKNSRSNYNIYLSRIGIFIGTFAMHGFYSKSAGRAEGFSLDLKQIFQVRNLKFAPNRKGMTGLTYELKSAVEPMPIDLVKLWYDPNTFKIARREFRVSHRGREETIIEDYTDVQLGGEKGVATPKEPPPAPVTDAEMENLFFKAKMTAAETHLQAGRKDQAAEILEEIIKSYPKHPKVPEARRLLEQAKKKS